MEIRNIWVFQSYRNFTSMLFTTWFCTYCVLYSRIIRRFFTAMAFYATIDIQCFAWVHLCIKLMPSFLIFLVIHRSSVWGLTRCQFSKETFFLLDTLVYIFGLLNAHFSCRYLVHVGRMLPWFCAEATSKRYLKRVGSILQLDAVFCVSAIAKWKRYLVLGNLALSAALDNWLLCYVYGLL